MYVTAQHMRAQYSPEISQRPETAAAVKPAQRLPATPRP
jgi:hypothetical protein